MRNYMKFPVLTLLFSLLFTTSILAKSPTVDEMNLKLAKLETSISQDKLKLMEREVNLNKLKVKSLKSSKIDRKNMAMKLAEIEASLAKDKLLLAEREAKLYEMKAALEKQKNR